MKIYKEGESGLFIKTYHYFKNTGEEFRLKNVDETRNYFLEKGAKLID